jgi:hypothetical protein
MGDSLRSTVLSAVKSSNMQGWLASNHDADMAVLVAVLDIPSTAKVLGAIKREVDGAMSSMDAGAEGSENVYPSSDGISSKQAEAFAFLRRVAELMLHFCADAGKPLPPAFMGIAASLHMALTLIKMSKDSRQCTNAIVRLCERLYLQGRPDAEGVISVATVVLLTEVTGEEGSEATLKRLFALRKALVAVDLDDPDSEFLRLLMLKCFSSPLVLRSAVGRKLLAAFMSAAPSMPAECHAAVKADFSAAILPPSNVQRWVGEVYARAWEEAGRESEPKAHISELPIRERIEQDALQNLLALGVSAVLPNVFDAARRMLSPFIEERSKPSRRGCVDAGILRVFEGVIWRALEANNAVLRKNAALLFSDVLFMGQHAETAKEIGGDKARTALLQKQVRPSHRITPPAPPPRLTPPPHPQVTALTRLCRDSYPAIRELGAKVVSDCLKTHWTDLSASATRGLLQAVVGLHEDTTSPPVRVAAVNGVISLLNGQIASHAVLLSEGHLATLSRLLHDKSDKVRCAVVRMLEVIGTFPGSFPDSWFRLQSKDEEEEEEGSQPKLVQQVLARLSFPQSDKPAEAEAVAGLVRLLVPFYVGVEAEGKGQSTKERFKARATAAFQRLRTGLLKMRLTTLVFLRQSAHLGAGVMPPAILANVASLLWKEATRKAVSLGDAAEEGDNNKDPVDAGFVRGKGGATKKRARAAKVTTAGSEAVSAAWIGSLVTGVAAIWESLDKALPGGSEEDGEGKEGNAETGGETTATVSEAVAVRNLLKRNITADDVASMLALVSARARAVEAEMGEGGDADAALWGVQYLEVTRSVTLCLVDIAKRLPSEELGDSLWKRLVSLTPAQLQDRPGVPSAHGPDLISALVTAMVEYGRGSALLDNCLASIAEGVRAVTEALSPGGEVDASEAELLDGVNTAGLVHPHLAPAILKAILAKAALSLGAEGAASDINTIWEASRLQAVMSTLVPGMTACELPLRAGPAAAASAAAAFASRLAVLCVDAWVTVDAKTWRARHVRRKVNDKLQALSREGFDTVEAHLRDAFDWMTSSLLPLLTTVTWAVRMGGAGLDVDANPALGSALCAAQAVVTALLHAGTDLLISGGLGISASLGVLRAVTSTSQGEAVGGIPGVDVEELSGTEAGERVTCSVSPLAWLTGAADLYKGDGGEENPAALKELRAAGDASHLAALGLTMHLWRACSKDDFTSVARESGADELFEIQLKQAERTLVTRSLSLLLTTGELVLGPVDADADERASAAFGGFPTTLARAVFVSLAAGSEETRTVALQALLGILLPEAEGCIPSDTLAAVAEGKIVEEVGAMGCAAAARILELASTSRWAAQASVSACATRLAFVTRDVQSEDGIARALAHLAYALASLPVKGGTWVTSARDAAGPALRALAESKSKCAKAAGKLAAGLAPNT